MRILFTALLSTFTALHTSAQSNDENPFRTLKNEISFGIMGGGDVRQSPYPMPGIGYKRFTENGAFRALVGGSINSNSSSSGGWSNVQEEGAFVARIGYQYHVMLGRFMPMIGLDLSGGYYTNEWSNNQFNWEKTENTVVGLSPNLGLEFWISPKLSFFIDTRFDIAYTNIKSEGGYEMGWPPMQTTYLNTSSGINTTIAPISTFMCAFHF